jgi:hypothetical protein
MYTSIPKDLIYPDRISLDDLVSWNRAMAQLGELAEDKRRAFCQAFLPTSLNHPVPMIRSTVEKLIKEEPHTALAMALLGVLAGRNMKAFVFSRGDNHAYEVVSDVWIGAFADLANPVTMALTGRFVITGCLRPCCAFDLEVLGNSLALSRKDLHRLSKLRGDRASLTRAARELLGKNEKMIHRNYLTEMRRQFPGASKAELMRARRLAYPELKQSKGGRPRKEQAMN